MSDDFWIGQWDRTGLKSFTGHGDGMASGCGVGVEKKALGYGDGLANGEGDYDCTGDTD